MTPATNGQAQQMGTNANVATKFKILFGSCGSSNSTLGFLKYYAIICNNNAKSSSKISHKLDLKGDCCPYNETKSMFNSNNGEVNQRHFALTRIKNILNLHKHGRILLLIAIRPLVEFLHYGNVINAKKLIKHW